MSVTNPVADMFTRIRNALRVKHDSVSMPHSKMKEKIAKILKEEGFIKHFDVVDHGSNKKSIKIDLKYSPDGKAIISNLVLKSTSSCRQYIQKKQIPKVLNGFGICILSTSHGILSGRDARLKNAGGELIGYVY
ncbi:MAG: 30S ribosomal protein S8 [Candidatus Margulisiibacteriota bacterium]